MHKNTQKYANTCKIQSRISISISEKNQVQPVDQNQSESWKQ